MSYDIRFVVKVEGMNGYIAVVEAFGYKETMLVGYGCNVCGYEVDVSEGDYNFCPNCGAKMEA